MSKQSGLSRSKSSKETQEETVKQAQSEQYRHQSNILDITLLSPPSTLYPIHTPLQSPHFNSKQKNADIAVIFLALEFKNLNFMAPFYGRGSTASRLEPLRGGSLLFTTKFPEISGTQIQTKFT